MPDSTNVRRVLGSALLTVCVISTMPDASLGFEAVTVSDHDGLRRALAEAKPGTTIRIAPGRYRGSVSARGLHGKADAPIVLEAADPKNPPVIEGGSGLHIGGASHIEVRRLILIKSSGNGINIDDGGVRDSSHHVVLRDLVVQDVGPTGNRDGIKLSGLDDLLVENCTVERWGTGGSGIDMVGCHRGRIVGCTFRHGDKIGDNAVQAKGGSSDIMIKTCRFEHAGMRAVNIGGSTGAPFYRPKAPGYEAKNVTVEDCTFIGSDAPVAFVGVDGALVHHNTFYRPMKYAVRILQETIAPEFVPSRNGIFTDNLIVFNSSEMRMPINISPHTAPETFTFARNAWFCLDAPARSRPRLPIPETEGIYGRDPRFEDADAGDLRLKPGTQTPQAGARRIEP